VFIDYKTIPPSNFGALIQALQALHSAAGDWDWTNRIYTRQRKPQYR